jgi:hypothetical protein
MIKRPKKKNKTARYRAAKKARIKRKRRLSPHGKRIA